MVEFFKKATSETDGSNQSSTMNLCGEHDSRQMIIVLPTFIINSTRTSQICTFCSLI